MNYKLNYILNKKFFLLAIACMALVCLNAQQKVAIKTSKGEIIVLLYEDTPIHQENFIKLVQQKFYDSLLFHRVIKDFMIQAGDPNSRPPRKTNSLGSGGPGYTIQAELGRGHIHKKGALAAARQGDNVNPTKRSSGSQFYIVQGRKTPRKYMSRFEESRGKTYSEEELEIYETIGGTPHLDGQYTVFGEVLKGLDVVDSIANTPTQTGDRPQEDIYIISMNLIK